MSNIRTVYVIEKEINGVPHYWIEEPREALGEEDNPISSWTPNIHNAFQTGLKSIAENYLRIFGMDANITEHQIG